MSTIIIITPPPPKKEPAPEGIAPSTAVCNPYREAQQALDAAIAEGGTVRIVEA